MIAVDGDDEWDEGGAVVDSFTSLIPGGELTPIHS